MQRCQNFLPTPLPGHELMPLKLRPTGLGSGIDKDRPDYTVVAVGGLVLSFALEK